MILSEILSFLFLIVYRLAIIGVCTFIYFIQLYNDISTQFSNVETNLKFDYIVVGGGSAGAIVASRLSEDPSVSVLLLEAGVTVPDILNIPALGPLKQQSSLDWSYRTVPQSKSCLGLKNQSSIWPAGKVLGGTTHLNYMLYVRGHEKDYASWANPKSIDWNYDDIMYYFKKSEEYIGRNDVNSEYHSKSKGLMYTRETSFTTELSEVVLQAAQELGYDINDVNSKSGIGFTRPQINMKENGVRWTADQSIQKKDNLKIITSANVVKILLLNDFEVYGVEYLHGGKVKKAFAKKEVVISAGAVGSPKLLMLSGIGPKDHLASLQIRPKINLAVGRNLQDHITTGFDLVKLNKTLFSMTDLLSIGSSYDYFVNGRGPLTTAVCEAVGIVQTDDVIPSLQFMAMMAGLSSDKGIFMKRTMGLSDKLWTDYFSHWTNETVVTILPVLLHPESQGEILLASNNPHDPPIIDPRYLTDQKDVETLIKGIRIIQRLVQTDAMKKLGARFNTMPLPGCESYQFDSEPYWECYLRHLTITSYHPVGTCKMGDEDDVTAVVDRYLRVHKTNKLRVIDASILPNLPSGNTNAAVVMIAEKGADLIRESYSSKRTCDTLDSLLNTLQCYLQ